jgi:hypothetical protein
MVAAVCESETGAAIDNVVAARTIKAVAEIMVDSVKCDMRRWVWMLERYEY